MAKTNKHELCQQFIRNRLTELNQQFDQCTTDLLTQSPSCSSKLLPLDILDHNLTEFVHLQQKYLSNKMNSQLNRYKDMIEEKKLYQNLSTYTLTNNQVIILHQNRYFSFTLFSFIFFSNREKPLIDSYNYNKHN